MTWTQSELQLVVIVALCVLCAVLLLMLFDCRRCNCEDSERINTIQVNQWRIACIDGKFAVIGRQPPVLLGSGAHSDLRAAIDSAVDGTMADVGSSYG